jgi:hypothetical protein
MTNDSEPHRVPDRMSARYAAWDPDCPRAIPFGAALLVAGLILLVTATHIVVAVVCVIIGAALLLRSLRQVRATLSARGARHL